MAYLKTRMYNSNYGSKVDYDIVVQKSSIRASQFGISKAL